MITVACVLRTGGDFDLEHVDRLMVDVDRHLAGVEFTFLTDWGPGGVPTVPLAHDWPTAGFWFKMELFRPDIPGDLLYFDLDTLVVGDLRDLTRRTRPTLMRDVYRPDGLQASVMYLPESDRAGVWEAWIADPEGHMTRYRDDQRFLEALWLDTADRWQDVLPGQLVSYKAHCTSGPPTEAGDEIAIPPGARVIVYHGRPRPWETPLWAA